MKKDRFGKKERGADMKVAIYCRVGNPSQLSSEELDNQADYLKEYCRKHDYEVAGIFKEQISGNNQLGPELHKAMNMISEKAVEGIVIKDLSRVSRDMHKFFRFEMFLRENNAKLIDSKLGVMNYSKKASPVYERKRRG